jgi:hypothetical protein
VLPLPAQDCSRGAERQRLADQPTAGEQTHDLLMGLLAIGVERQLATCIDQGQLNPTLRLCGGGQVVQR